MNHIGIVSLMLVALASTSIAHAQEMTWESIGGPAGGGLAPVVESNGALYTAAGYDGGFRSTDGGERWDRLTIAGSSRDITFVGVAADGALVAGGADDPALYWSDDDGADWHVASVGPTGLRWTAPNGFMRASDGTLYVSEISGGLLISRDNGRSWIAQHLFGNPNRLAEDSAGNVYAGNREGYFARSTDAGVTWSGIPLPEEIAIHDLFVAPSGDVLMPTNLGGFHRSTDNGLSFERTDTAIGVIQRLGRTVGGTVVAFGLERHYRSLDLGRTWSPFEIRGLGATGVEHVTCDRSGSLWLTTRGSGLKVSTDDGESFVPAFTPRSFGALALAIADDGTIFGGTFEAGIYRSSPDGTEWEEVFAPYRYKGNAGLSSIRDLDVDDRGRVFAATHGSSIFRSDDHGATWLSLGSGLSSFHSNGVSLHGTWGVESFEPGIVVLYTLGEGIFRSSDDGVTWSHVTDAGASFFLERGPGDHLYAGGKAETLRRSTDGGLTWHMLPTPGYIRSIAFDPGGSPIYAGVTAGGTAVAVSYDDGRTWRIPSTQRFAKEVGAIAVDSRGTVYIATGGNGVFRSTDHGVTWTDISDGLPHRDFASIIVDHQDRPIVGGTRSGLFRWTSQTSSAPAARTDDARAPRVRVVDRAYGELAFTAARAGEITLLLTSIDGAVRTRQRLGWRDAGEHRERWSIPDVPTGAYVLRLAGPGIDAAVVTTIVE